MWEMIAGNNGNRDECININMDKNLFSRLQTKVTVFKKILDNTSQATDKSFVYIGSFDSKDGAYSLYGFSSRLENDGRGGDYSSFIAVETKKDCAEIKLEDIFFLDETGFAKYAYEKYNSSDFDGFVEANKDSRENRFAMSIEPIAITVGAKKRIVNALLSALSQKKGESVAFCFDEADIDLFNKKAIFILLEVMKYIPYALRKDIGFLSNVRTKGKVSELINIAAYPKNFAFAPRNIIDITDETNLSDKDTFYAFIEKIFAMDDAAREEYFKLLQAEIEKPLGEKDFAVKSDFYLLDIITKPLWTNGDATEAVANIFASVDNILNVYPAYLNIAKLRLAKESDAVAAYAKNAITGTSDANSLKGEYTRLEGILGLCEIDFQIVLALTAQRALDFISAVQSDAGLLQTADDILKINAIFLDIPALREVIAGKLKGFVASKGSLDSVYDIYVMFKEKTYVDVASFEADVCQRIEELICAETDAVEAGKDKLNRLEQMYRMFVQSYGDNCEPICSIYARYFDTYSKASADQAVERDLKLLADIEEKMYACADADWFNFFTSAATGLTSLATDDEEVKSKAKSVYARLTENLYRVIRDNNELSYGALCEFCENAGSRVEALKRKGIHDKELKNIPLVGDVPADGAWRFMSLLNTFIEALRETKKLDAVIGVYDRACGKIGEGETEIKAVFGAVAPIVIKHRIEKNKIKITLKEVDKQICKIRKSEDISDATEKFFERIAEEIAVEKAQLAELKREKCRNSFVGRLVRNKWTWIISGIVVSLAILATLAIIFIPKIFAPEDTAENKPQSETNLQVENIAKYIAAQAELDEVDAYLNGFGEGYKDVGIVLGKLEKAEDGSGYTVTADNTLVINEGIAEPIKAMLELADAGKSKFVAESVIKPESAYIVVVANKDGASVLLDVYEFSGDLAEYDYAAAESAIQLPDGVDKVFFQKLIRYVGVKCGYVMTEAQAAETGKEEETETEEPQADINSNGEEIENGKETQEAVGEEAPTKPGANS